MSQREKDAVATLVYTAALMGLGVICWLQHSMASILWLAGPMSMAYGLFMALSHAVKKKRGCVYDERDAMIEGKAWRAALNGAVFGFGFYAVAIVLVYGQMGVPLGEVTIPLVTLPVGVIMLIWAASVTWAVATLRHTRFMGRVDANREPSS